MNLMLDIYTSNIYHVKYSTGLMGKIGSLFDAESNFIFALLALLSLVAFIVLAIASVLPVWEGAFSKKLKSEGLTIVAFCAVAFFIFLIAPALIKSIIWSSIPSSDVARDIIRIIESRVVSSLLLDDILIALVGVLIYAVGFFIDRKAGDSVDSYAAPRSRQDAGKRAAPPAQPKAQPKKGGQPQGKSKYKGLESPSDFFITRPLAA
jgi:hypothetical protein